MKKEADNFKKNKAIFWDRDGVINEALPRGQYLVKKEQFILEKDISKIIDFSKRAGFLAIIATNQPQISKGLLTLDGLKDIHDLMSRQLKIGGAAIDKIYFCPHQNSDDCDCRKPKTDLFLKAIIEFNIDPSASFVVGDSDKDIIAGLTIGCRTIFIKNNFNSDELKKCQPDFIVNDLNEIKKIIF